MLRDRLVPLCLLLAATACRGPEPTVPRHPGPSSPGLATARQELERADRFAGPAVGYAGLPSPGARALAILWNTPDARTEFHALFENASPAGRLYALLALRHLDPEGAAARAATVQDGHPVESMRGCTIAELPMSRLVEQIRDGRWDDLAEYARSGG